MSSAGGDGQSQGFTPLRITLVVLAVAGCVATFLPWVEIGMISVNGTRGSGLITLVGFAGVLGFALGVGKRSAPIPMNASSVVMVVALACAALGAFHLSGFVGSGIIGPGLYLVVGAGVAIALVAGFGCRWWLGSIGLFVVTLTTASGFVHVVYNDTSADGSDLCPKTRWSLTNTFVDADSYSGKHVTTEGANVVHALVDCEVLKYRQPEAPVEVPSYGSCDVGGSRGTCIAVESCRGSYTAGLCTGPGNVQCCVQ